MVPLVKEKNEDERICSLDGLRGLAALAVVAFHYTGGGLHRLLPGGQFVTLFFILSGLVLSIAPLRVGTGSYDWPRYQLRRIVRLAVPTCSAVGACCIVSTVTVRTGREAPGYATMFAASPPSEWLHDLLTQLDMLSMTTAGSRVDGSVLAMVDLPSWSMCWELLFSLALPIYVVIATDMRIVAPVVLACVLVAEWAQWPPLRHMAVFALGVALARSLVDRGRESMRGIVAVPAALCGVVLICQSGLGVLPGVVAQPLAVCGCLLLVVVALARNAVSDALSTAPVRWLGRVSFSLYLTHLPVRDWLVPYIPVRGALRPVLLILLCLLVAEVFHLLVERPATMLSRRLGR